MPTKANQTLYSDWEQVTNPNPFFHCCGKTARNNDEDYGEGGDDREGECCTEALQLKKQRIGGYAMAKAKPAMSLTNWILLVCIKQVSIMCSLLMPY